MRRFLLPVVMVAVLSLTGCDWVLSLFGSEEAAIVAFAFDGVEGSASINPETRTVEIEIIPIDLSMVTPVVEVSEGAVLGALPDFVDGEPVTIEVTAENGEVVEWTVTVILQLGASFNVDGERVVLQGGYTDSEDTQWAASWGNGRPPGSVTYYEELIVNVNDNLVDFASYTSPVEDIFLSFYGSTAGAYDSQSFYLDYYRDRNGDYDPEVSFWFQDGTATISSIGEIGEIITGTFAAEGINGFEGPPVSITSGFFKVVRIDDDMFGE